MKTRHLPIAIPVQCSLVVVFALLLSALFAPLMGQHETLKEKALAQFENANYPAAIEYLQQALADSPNDADIYYYLGYFTHYLCYDSVPLTGFGRAKSDEVLRYLEKAVKLDPHYGNAYYFIGAEYGARARDQMQRGNMAGAVEEFRSGRQTGGYPDWMMEFGRNMLRSCAPNAILFTSGDFDANSVEYLQCVEGYRTDVTAIPLALLERPSFVALFKRGATGIMAPAPISWGDEQIAEMHPYKWKKNTIRIPVPEEIGRAQATGQTDVEWELSPDLGLGKELGLLSAGRAVFADIVLTNRWERPIYFSTGCPPRAWEGLASNLQSCGIAYRLLPFAPPTSVDVETTTALLLDQRNFQFLPTLRDSDMPRVSVVLQNYRASFLSLAQQHIRQGEFVQAKAVLAAMNKLVPEDILPISEYCGSMIEALKQTLNKHE
jgi:tetratricopeptide (TPR) repeat protein